MNIQAIALILAVVGGAAQLITAALVILIYFRIDEMATVPSMIMLSQAQSDDILMGVKAIHDGKAELLQKLVSWPADDIEAALDAYGTAHPDAYDHRDPR